MNKGILTLFLLSNILSIDAMVGRGTEGLIESLSDEKLASKSDQEVYHEAKKSIEELFDKRPLVAAYLAIIHDIGKRSTHSRAAQFLPLMVPSQMLDEGNLNDFCRQAGISFNTLLRLVQTHEPEQEDHLLDIAECFVGSPHK